MILMAADEESLRIAEQIEREAPTIDDARSGVQVAPILEEADLKRELLRLDEMLGDTRVRYRQRQTRFASSQKLIDLDLEIREALALPPSAELQLEVRQLIARLQKLDPH